MAPPISPHTPATPGDRLPAGLLVRAGRRRRIQTVELPPPPADQPGNAPDTAAGPVSAPEQPGPALVLGPVVDLPRPFRRVVICGTHVGKAYSLADVHTLWSRYGPPGVDLPAQPHIHW